jgi:5-hydroxyisourate hydrolase-like protein (transthyretin family)
MRQRFVPVFVALATLASPTLAQQQSAPQTIKGRIEGTVLREGTTEPVAGAKVTVTRVNAQGAAVPVAGTLNTFLINPTANVPFPPGPNPNGPPPGQTPPPPPLPQPPPIPSVITDRGGKFVVPDLDEGTYRVAVTLNGYVRMEYGQRAFGGQGTTLRVTKGIDGRIEVLKDLVVRLTRAGNISGRISDENGQPASGVPVQLLKVTYNANGVRLFQQAGTARTNDRGEYRLYWITPGRYFLAGGTPPGPAPGAGPGGNPSANENPDPYTFTYFPGTTDLSRATAVDVKAGAEIPMDFIVSRTQLFKISGRIVGADTGVPQAAAQPPGISLGFLRPEGGSGFIMMSQTYDPVTGDFTLRNVVPGSYALQVNAGATTARAAVEVINADVNVNLILGGGVNITGKAQIAGGAAIPAQANIRLKPILKGVSHWVGGVPAAPIAVADGVFRLDRVLPGEYQATVTAPGHYVKELRFDNVDVLNSPFEISEGRSGAPTFDVVLSSNVAQIDGMISDATGQPLPGVQAVLVPDRNRDRADLFKAAATDQSGRFSMKDIAPGDYKLFSWENLENFGYFEPDFIRKYELQGKPVRVEEGAKLNVDTKVIPESSR